MKKVIIALFCLTLSVTAANAQNKSAASPTPATPAAAPSPAPVPAAAAPDPDAGKFKFKEEIHNFGEVPEGPFAEYDFEFKNVGKKPIQINEAHGSCGCTVPTYPHDPILPGASGKIHVQYNTDHRPGMIDKSITINSNAVQAPMMLYIKGNVKAKPVEATPPPAPAPAPANK